MNITPSPELYQRMAGLCKDAGGFNKAALAALAEWCDRQEQAGAQVVGGRSGQP